MEVADERLTEKQVAVEFNINAGTLRWWRRRRLTDKSVPRYHKYQFSKKIFYLRSEIEEDLKGEAY